MTASLSSGLTDAQAWELRQQLARAGLSPDMAELMLRNSSISVVMMRALRAHLTSNISPLKINWKHPSLFSRTIEGWGVECGWSLPDALIEGLQQALVGRRHPGPLQPLSVDFWLNKTLPDNLQLVLWRLRHVAKCREEEFDCIDLRRCTAPDDQGGDERYLRPVVLDLSKYWDLNDGIVPAEVMSAEPRWPGMAAVCLAALNPDVVFRSDDELVPALVIPGIRVGDDEILRIRRGVDGLIVDAMSIHKITRAALVAFL